MKQRYLALIIASLGLLAASSASALSTDTFIQKATVAGEFEIESSKLALEKSQDPDIKRFAQRMIDDHTKINEQLASTLQSQQIEAPALDDKHQKMIDKLQSLSGDDFNHKYVSMQLDAHKQAVKLFTKYSKHGDNDALKEFAAQTLPTLQSHLAHIKKINKKFGWF